MDLDQTLYALDSTINRPLPVAVSVGQIPPAQGRREDATLLDLHGNIPTFIRIRCRQSANILDEFFPRPDVRRHGSGLSGVSSCSRSVRPSSWCEPKRTFCCSVATPTRWISTGLRSDHTVLTSFNSAQAYPDPLRRVSYFDAESNKRLKFLTNNFTLPALTIDIYKSRWQVELFFKWIKQHLRIKSFYGTSENAVKTQIGSLSRFTCSRHGPETPRAGSESLPDSTDSQPYYSKKCPFTGTPAIRLPKRIPL